MIIDTERPTPCVTNMDLFHSPDDDGRTEVGREDRESLAGLMCFSDCPLQLLCLERAMVTREPYGVWGGMGEGERRKFRTHLNEEGYGRREVPSGGDLYNSLLHYYYYQATPQEKYHGEEAA